MKIAILTSGRFHVLDLAHELDRLGHEVTFYSLLPNSRAIQFGLPTKCNHSLLPWMAPFFAAHKISPERWKLATGHLLRAALDELVARTIGPCDVLIGMSGLTVKAAEAVKKKYGAKIWLERGSRHIRSQKEILDAIPGLPVASKVPDIDVEREEIGYQLADVIVLGSRHCVESFTERGFSNEKLFRNPYGVDLSMFAATDVPTGPPTICNQPKLREFYAQAHVLVLPSREDGFGMVMAQAFSCGLPVVATTYTGGPDLAAVLERKEWVTLVPPQNVDALAEGLRKALELSKTQSGTRQILGNAAQQLSWQAYGERYHQELLRRMGKA
jgi:starch synthase